MNPLSFLIVGFGCLIGGTVCALTSIAYERIHRGRDDLSRRMLNVGLIEIVAGFVLCLAFV